MPSHAIRSHKRSRSRSARTMRRMRRPQNKNSLKFKQRVGAGGHRFRRMSRRRQGGAFVKLENGNYVNQEPICKKYLSTLRDEGDFISTFFGKEVITIAPKNLPSHIVLSCHLDDSTYSRPHPLYQSLALMWIYADDIFYEKEEDKCNIFKKKITNRTDASGYLDKVVDRNGKTLERVDEFTGILNLLPKVVILMGDLNLIDWDKRNDRFRWLSAIKDKLKTKDEALRKLLDDFFKDQVLDDQFAVTDRFEVQDRKHVYSLTLPKAAENGTSYQLNIQLPDGELSNLDGQEPSVELFQYGEKKAIKEVYTDIKIEKLSVEEITARTDAGDADDKSYAISFEIQNLKGIATDDKTALKYTLKINIQMDKTYIKDFDCKVQGCNVSKKTEDTNWGKLTSASSIPILKEHIKFGRFEEALSINVIPNPLGLIPMKVFEDLIEPQYAETVPSYMYSEPLDGYIALHGNGCPVSLSEVTVTGESLPPIDPKYINTANQQQVRDIPIISKCTFDKKGNCTFSDSLALSDHPLIKSTVTVSGTGEPSYNYLVRNIAHETGLKFGLKKVIKMRDILIGHIASHDKLNTTQKRILLSKIPSFHREEKPKYKEFIQELDEISDKHLLSQINLHISPYLPEDIATKKKYEDGRYTALASDIKTYLLTDTTYYGLLLQETSGDDGTPNGAIVQMNKTLLQQ